MKKIKSLVALVVLVLVFSTCEEMIPGVNDNPEEEQPEPTPVGFPNGIPVSKTIGAAGGTASIDGKVQVEIPAGALSGDTEITIQPINNNAPNGSGNAYRLGPEGTTFNKPVKLTFPSAFADNGPALTGIAFQDEDGIWYHNGKLTWNKTNSTVTTETTHFSDWATFDALAIICDGCEGGPELYKLKEGESGDFKLRLIAPVSDDDLLSPIVAPLATRNYYAFDRIMDEWFANGERNGSAQNGTITPNSKGCVYKAPNRAPRQGKNPVSLSVTLKDLKYKDPATGNEFNDLQLSTNVKILGELKYDVSIEFHDNTILTGGLVGVAFLLRDAASLRITIKNDSVFLSNFQNSPGIVTPGSQIDPYGNNSTCTSTSFLGPLNFTEGSGLVAGLHEGKIQLWLTLEGKTETPTFEFTAATGGKVAIGSQTGWFVLYPILDLLEPSPTWVSPGSDIIKVKLTEVE